MQAAHDINSRMGGMGGGGGGGGCMGQHTLDNLQLHFVVSVVVLSVANGVGRV